MLCVGGKVIGSQLGGISGKDFDGELQLRNVSALATSEEVFLVVQDVVLREIVPCEVFLVPQNHFANDTFSVALVMPE